MGSLSPELLRSRLAYDHEVVRELRAPILGCLRAFASEQERRAGHEVDADRAALGGARLYEVEYRFPVLVGAGRTTDRVLVRFDLLAGGNYPHSEPLVAVVSRPLPWSPHVHPGSGVVCLGKGWKANRTLFAHLVVHVARALNCDEPDLGPGYEGWNGDAVRYWRKELKSRPLNALVYPVLPSRLTHGVGDEATFRRAAATDAAFTPIVADRADAVFAPVALSAAHEPDPAFRPIRLAS